MPRIVCPNCSARYEIAAEVLGAAGRKVRCVRCGHVWQARAEGGAEAGGGAEPAPWPEPPGPRVRDPGEEPPTEAVRTGPPPDIPPPAAALGPAFADRAALQATDAERGAAAPTAVEARGSGTLLLAWVLSLAVLGAAGWGAIAYRSAVIEAWPASTHLYALFGLDG